MGQQCSAWQHLMVNACRFSGGSFTSPKPREVAHVRMPLPFWQMAKVQVGFGDINVSAEQQLFRCHSVLIPRNT